MEPHPQTLAFFRPSGPDRVALLELRPLPHDPTHFILQVSRGPSRKNRAVAITVTPIEDKDVAARVASAVDDLNSEGFLPAGVHRALQQLHHPKAATRARAALRLGRLRATEAIPALLAAGAQGLEGLSSVIDALGALGDPRALPLCRAEAERKLLSRRRSGVEALRRLGDADGLAGVRLRALDRLAPAVRDALVVVEKSTSPQDLKSLVDALTTLPARDQGLCLDSLYELGSPPAVAAVRTFLAGAKVGVPFLWRGVKSVFKRSMLRGDREVFGLLAWKLERCRLEPGAFAVLKSGLDGVDRPTRVFQKNTRHFVQRLAWRHLRTLARVAPEEYAPTAAAVLVCYTQADADPKAKYPAWEWSACHLLHRILWNRGGRFAVNARSLRSLYTTKTVKFPAPGVREEAFPELWDRSPQAYVTLAAGARLPALQAFAHAALAGPHQGALQAAPREAVVAMLAGTYAPTVDLAAAEFERRFDATNPDWDLLQLVLTDTRPRVLDLARKCLERAQEAWTLDPERSLAFLAHGDASVRALAAGLVAQALDGADPFYRRELAERLLAKLTTPEPTEGLYEGLARVAREALAPELGAMLSVDEVLALFDKASGSFLAVCGTLLGQKPEALDRLGFERIALLGDHAVASVRAAAQALLRSAIGHLKDDPSVLYTLAESDWADSRAVALDLLQTQVDVAALGIDGIVGLCDSQREDVQALGRALVLRHFASLEPAELVKRLSQHPAPAMRRFAVDLVVAHLRPGFVALSSVEGFLRAALLDLWPSRREKRTVLDFLEERGLADAHQAELSARLLGEFARTRGRGDFDRAMVALVRIGMKYPEAPSAVALGVGLTGVTP